MADAIAASMNSLRHPRNPCNHWRSRCAGKLWDFEKADPSGWGDTRKRDRRSAAGHL